VLRSREGEALAGNISRKMDMYISCLNNIIFNTNVINTYIKHISKILYFISDYLTPCEDISVRGPGIHESVEAGSCGVLNVHLWELPDFGNGYLTKYKSKFKSEHRFEKVIFRRN
jgi:hypothetical protein